MHKPLAYKRTMRFNQKVKVKAAGAWCGKMGRVARILNQGRVLAVVFPENPVQEVDFARSEIVKR